MRMYGAVDVYVYIPVVNSQNTLKHTRESFHLSYLSLERRREYPCQPHWTSLHITICVHEIERTNSIRLGSEGSTKPKICSYCWSGVLTIALFP